ncbi:MAG TPA: hypothetical protein VET85_14175 [Stellaceae bacterium]|nr:hypothetical protein [Stellaceae bacterium]
MTAATGVPLVLSTFLFDEAGAALPGDPDAPPFAVFEGCTVGLPDALEGTLLP